MGQVAVTEDPGLRVLSFQPSEQAQQGPLLLRCARVLR